jgi:Abnormal spindle-like microcephaly-assoc'd, ASPM-SPD-2-Hydin
MRIQTVLLLVAPLLSLAQTPPAAPPPEVDQALRAQATAFLKYQMEGNFRKAYELVAEDSQDYYLGAPKEKSASLELQKIEYSDNFTKAAVTSASKQTLIMEGRPIEIPSGRLDRWKLENGQWKWYHDASKDVVMTMVGAMPASSPASATGPKLELPKDFTPEEAEKAVKRVPVPKASVPTLNRRTMSFTVGKESTEEIVFHNNSPGEVRVEADLIADFPGFVVQPKKFQLKAQEEITFKVSYHPSAKGVFNAALRLTVQPFESEVRIPLILSMESAAGKP